MIIKSISTGNAGNLIRYIFKDTKIVPKENSKYVQYLRDRQLPGKDIYVAGKPISKTAVSYLMKEHADWHMYMAAKHFKGTKEEFMQHYLNSGKVPAEGRPFILTKNVHSRDVGGIIKEFDAVNERRIHKRSDQTNAMHTIMSWSTKDAKLLTDSKLKSMAQEFMRLRGDTVLYAITKHVDKEHVHLHIAISGTQLNGQSSRISQNQFSELKLEMSKFQRSLFPELENSLPEHGKKGQKTYKFDERTSLKNSLHGHLAEAFIKAKSTEHFKSQLMARDIATYDRSGQLTGVVANGIKFRFSRLGIDLELLQELDAKLVKEKNTLQELREMREQKARDRVQAKNTSRSINNTEIGFLDDKNADENDGKPKIKDKQIREHEQDEGLSQIAEIRNNNRDNDMGRDAEDDCSIDDNRAVTEQNTPEDDDEKYEVGGIDDEADFEDF